MGDGGIYRALGHTEASVSLWISPWGLLEGPKGVGKCFSAVL